MEWTCLVRPNRGRNTLQQYKALFTCLVNCEIHVEMIKSMDIVLLILALGRFIGRMGKVCERQIPFASSHLF